MMAQSAQVPAKAASAKAQRFHETTLAALRPGRDSLPHAKKIYPYGKQALEDKNTTVWNNICAHQAMYIQADTEGKIQTIRVSETDEMTQCEFRTQPPPNLWITGYGLHIFDLTSRVMQLYGQPDSRSPSTKGGQQLELLYYAFDWAGPDVPQVMEVLCTPEKNGEPGRVVEITLAAASL